MDKLQYLDEAFSMYLAANDQRGEPWQADYKKYDDLFKRLLQVEARTQRKVYETLKDFSNRTDVLVNWTEYEYKAIKNRAATMPPPNSGAWQEFRNVLAELLFAQLAPAFGVGSQYQMRDAKLNLDFSENSEPAIKWLRNHVAELVRNVTDTTRKRINQSLAQSISAGLERSDAARALVPLIKDEYRAEVIAHTESVRAFSQGRIQTLTNLGIPSFKTWRNTFDPCEICIDLSRHPAIPIDQDFDSSYIGQIDAPPAHPWCRCSLRISFKPEDLE